MQNREVGKKGNRGKDKASEEEEERRREEEKRK